MDNPFDDGYTPQGDPDMSHSFPYGTARDQFNNSDASFMNQDHFYGHAPASKNQRPIVQVRGHFGAPQNPVSGHEVTTGLPNVGIPVGVHAANLDVMLASPTPTTPEPTVTPHSTSMTPKATSKKSKKPRQEPKFASKEEEANYRKRRTANNQAAQKSRANKAKLLKLAEAKIKDLESKLEKSMAEVIAHAETIDTLTKSNAALSMANQALANSNQTLTNTNSDLIRRRNQLENQMMQAKKIVGENRYRVAVARRACDEKDKEIHALKTTIQQLESEKASRQSSQMSQSQTLSGSGQSQEFHDTAAWDSNLQWPEFEPPQVVASGFASKIPQNQAQLQAPDTGHVEQKLADDDISFDTGNIDDDELNKILREFFLPNQNTGNAAVSATSAGNVFGWSIDQEVSSTFHTA